MEVAEASERQERKAKLDNILMFFSFVSIKIDREMVAREDLSRTDLLVAKSSNIYKCFHCSVHCQCCSSIDDGVAYILVAKAYEPRVVGLLIKHKPRSDDFAEDHLMDGIEQRPGY